MYTFLADIKFGLRTLGKTPGFAAVAVLTLALGIGANSALFSVVNGVLLNPLPYSEPDRIMQVYTKVPQFGQSSTSYMDFLDWEKDNQSFSALGTFRNENYLLTGEGEGERLRGYMVSAGFFPALGVHPVCGRLFGSEEDRIGGRPVVVISEGLWKRRFGAAPGIVGRTITLTGRTYEITGVIPASFTLYGRPPEVYAPIGQWDDKTFRTRGVSFGAQVIGRLKNGVSQAQARADMEHVAAKMAAAYPETNKDCGITLMPLKEAMVGDLRPLLLMLLGAVGFVLLIACANMANLTLARATGRAQELAVRAALGAGRGRMMRQLLTESALLAAAGGSLGLALAYWGTQAMLRTLPRVLPRATEVRLDWHVAAFTAGTSLLVGALFGLVPALRMSHTSLHATLKEAGRGASGGHHRAQSAFVAAEMAMALVLLAGAGLMVRTLGALWSVQPGFNPHNLLTFSMSLPRGLENNPDGQRTLLRNIHEALLAVPGVRYASTQGGSLPMNGDSELPFWVEGRPKPGSVQDMPFALFYLVEPQYLEAMGTPLRRGRFLSDQDREHAPPVVVIDETFARELFPTEDPVGKRINLAILDVQAEVVGVAAHVKHFGLDTDASAKIQAQMYVPLMQLPDRFMPLLRQGIGVVARTQGPPEQMAEPIRQAMSKMNGDQVVYGVQTMDDIVANSIADRRFTMILLAVFAGLAVALAGVGIYGVVSYLVGQRTREIGVRMALGAQRRDILGLVFRQGGGMALAGVAIGLGGAFTLTRLMKGMIFSVTATDPLTLAGVSILLLGVALLACYVPALRAMRTDPVVALRYE